MPATKLGFTAKFNKNYLKIFTMHLTIYQYIFNFV